MLVAVSACVAGLLSPAGRAYPQDLGSLDPTFALAGLGFDGGVTNAVVQPDGKVIVTGSFLNYGVDVNGNGGTPVGEIARLNPDGSLDASFNTGTGFNSTANALALQSDGKVVVVGFFTSFNEQPANRIARLNADGSLDTSFVTGTGGAGGLDSTGDVVLVESDGKILVGGNFKHYNGSQAIQVVRISPDGTRDTGFNSALSNFFEVYNFLLQTDGRIVVVGGRSAKIARLNPDGTLDPSLTFNLPFVPNSGQLNAVAQSLAMDGQPDGDLFVIGQALGITSGASQQPYNIAKIVPGAGFDPTFSPNPKFLMNPVTALLVQSDGRIIVGGGTNASTFQLSRLNLDGSYDLNFDVPPGLLTGKTTSFTALTGGKILVTNSGVTNQVFRIYAGTSTAPPPPKPSISLPGNALPNGTAGQAYLFQVVASGNPTAYSAQGLPDGLAIDPTSGVINGTPTDTSASTVTLSATNRSGTTTVTVSLTVGLPPPPPTPTPTLSLQAPVPVAYRSGSQAAVFRIRIGPDDEDLAAPLTISYGVSGTAVGGEDYQTLSGQATIPAGQRRVKIKVVPLKHRGSPPKATVILNLLPATNGAYLLGPDTATQVKIRKAPGQ